MKNDAVILLIDDVPRNIQVLGEILKDEGYSFAIAMNGKETFRLLEKKLPDLILLDVMLPDTDGFEICRKLKEKKKTANIPVIFLTARTETEDKIRGLELGAVDYITKPFEEAEVIARVRTHVQLKKSKDLIRLYYESLEKEKELLEKMAITDDLTQIFNRRHIISRLNDEIKRSERHRGNLSVVMIDVDRFKLINDTYGHQTGDKVLKQIADTMKKSLRETDILGRYGGEEFLAVLPETDLNNAFHAAEKMRKKICDLQWEEAGLHVTISCGIAEFKIKEKDFELLKRADDLLYKAKAEGRDKSEF